MKRICLLVLSFLIFLLSFNISFASVKYELPYPGLLPDSPLYFLRVARDRIVSFLIADPNRKAEFDLLQADKRLNAGIYLFDKNKISLSASTISKAENYFEEALANAREAQREGMDVTEIAKNLLDSSMKHQEVVSSLKGKSPQNFKENFNTEVQRIIQFQKEVNGLTPKR